MDADQFTNAAGCSRTCIGRCFDCAHLSADHHSNVATADLFLADQVDPGCLDHGVGSFDSSHEATRLDHSQGYLVGGSLFHEPRLPLYTLSTQEHYDEMIPFTDLAPRR